MVRPRSPRLPDGALGMAAAIVVCAAGAALAIEVGLPVGISIVVAVAAALLGSIAVKIGVDWRTARIVKAIADGDIEPDAAPDRIRARLASPDHRRTLGRALRKIATDAGKWPWQGRLAAPPIIPHLEPETCSRLVLLAELLESADDLGLRGVAMVEDLVTSPSSPLFGANDDEIEAAVRRAAFTLDVD